MYAIIINQVIRGIGIGLLNAPVMSAALNSVKKELIPEASSLIPATLQIGASFGIAFIGNELEVRQVYHLNQYARDINYNSPIYHNMINLLQSDIINKASSYLRFGAAFPSNKLAFFDYLIQMFASIASYGDAFAILGYITLGGALIAIFIKNKTT